MQIQKIHSIDTNLFDKSKSISPKGKYNKVVSEIIFAVMFVSSLFFLFSLIIFASIGIDYGSNKYNDIIKNENSVLSLNIKNNNNAGILNSLHGLSILKSAKADKIVAVNIDSLSHNPNYSPEFKEDLKEIFYSLKMNETNYYQNELKSLKKDGFSYTISNWLVDDMIKHSFTEHEKQIQYFQSIKYKLYNTGEQ